jgi:MFS family permease
MNGAILLMDRFGRKNVFMLGIASTAACLAAEAALTKYFVQTGSTNRVGLGFGVFFIFLYVVFFASCMDAQQYVIVSETFPMEFRSIGVAISLAAQYCAAALFVGVAPISTHSKSPKIRGS